jgi:hypothetical protein
MVQARVDHVLPAVQRAQASDLLAAVARPLALPQFWLASGRSVILLWLITWLRVLSLFALL